jgi:hypothetical protein
MRPTRVGGVAAGVWSSKRGSSASRSQRRRSGQVAIESQGGQHGAPWSARLNRRYSWQTSPAPASRVRIPPAGIEKCVRCRRRLRRLSERVAPLYCHPRRVLPDLPRRRRHTKSLGAHIGLAWNVARHSPSAICESERRIPLALHADRDQPEVVEHAVQDVQFRFG